jgi:Zn-dependent protease with chaperone function
MARQRPRETRPQLIERLQREAARRPALYRMRLAALAVAGDLALMAMQIVPIVAMVVVGALLYWKPWFLWLGGAVILFFIWLLRPTFEFGGHELKREDAPELFAAMDVLRERLEVPARMQVFIDESFNAGASEARGLFGLAGRRCGLILGVPLLAALSREQVLAVIAHEFGHFSRRHGRLGHWIYRARLGWLQYAGHVGSSSSPYGRAMNLYAERFVPYFSTRSFVYSRQCEYEADRDASLAAGGAIFAEALTCVAVIGRLWNDGFPRRLAELQRSAAEPPDDFHEKFAAAAREWPAAALRAWLDKEMSEPSGWLDTHPSLSDRLASLQQTPRFAHAAQNAGSALLGATWPGLLAEFNGKWRKSIEGTWLLEHLRLKHIVTPLAHAGDADAKQWPAARQLARAQALQSVDPERGEVGLRSLYQARPDDPHVTFAYAAMLLEDQDPAGLEIMESVAKAHATFRMPAYTRGLAYHRHKGDQEQAAIWSERAQRSAERRFSVAHDFMIDALAGKAETSDLPQEVRNVLAEAVCRDPVIVKGWLMQGSVPYGATDADTGLRLKLHALVLVIATAEMQKKGESEEDIARRYEQAMEALVAPDEHYIVRTYYNTEIIPAALSASGQLGAATS